MDWLCLDSNYRASKLFPASKASRSRLCLDSNYWASKLSLRDGSGGTRLCLDSNYWASKLSGLLLMTGSCFALIPITGRANSP